MRVERALSRRGFFGLAAGAVGGTLLGCAAAEADAVSPHDERSSQVRHESRQVLIYDPDFVSAPTIPEWGEGASSEVRALKGDRVRFAHQLSREDHPSIAGLTRYIDYLVVVGTMEEAAYRLVRYEVLTPYPPRRPTGAGLVVPSRGGAQPIFWLLRRRA